MAFDAETKTLKYAGEDHASSELSGNYTIWITMGGSLTGK